MPSLEELLRTPLAELTERFVEREHPVPRGLLEALEADNRQGARARSAHPGPAGEEPRRGTTAAPPAALRGGAVDAGPSTWPEWTRRGWRPWRARWWPGRPSCRRTTGSRGWTTQKILDEEKREELAVAHQARRGGLGGGRGGGGGDRQDQHLPRGAAGDAPSGAGADAGAGVRAGGRADHPRVPVPPAGHHPRRRAVDEHRGGVDHREDDERSDDGGAGHAVSRATGWPRTRATRRRSTSRRSRRRACCRSTGGASGRCARRSGWARPGGSRAPFPACSSASVSADRDIDEWLAERGVAPPDSRTRARAALTEAAIPRRRRLA